MENKDKKQKTEVFPSPREDKEMMIYDPSLDNLPPSKLALKKIEEANRHLKLNPPPAFFLDGKSYID